MPSQNENPASRVFLTPPDAPTTDLLPQGVPCVGCGYSLCGLTLDRSCPECGRAIAHSVVTDASSIEALLWFGERVKAWQSHSTMLVLGIILLPSIFGALAVALGTFAIHIWNILHDLLPPATIDRRALHRRLAPIMLSLMAGVMVVWSQWTEIPALLIGAALLLQVVSIGLLGQSLRHTAMRFKEGHVLPPLTKLDRVFVCGAGLVAATVLILGIFAVAEIDVRQVKHRIEFLLIAAIALGAATMLVGAIMHAWSLRKYRKQVDLIIANGKRCLYLRGRS